MRFALLVLVGLLSAGCVVQPDSQLNPDQNQFDGDSQEIHYDYPGAGGPTGCYPMTQVITTVIDGATYSVTIPVPCKEELWLDPSDPPPDEEVDQRVDPDPGQVLPEERFAAPAAM